MIIANKILKPLKNFKKAKNINKVREVCYRYPSSSLIITSVIIPLIIVIGMLLVTNTNRILTIKIAMLAVIFLGVPNLVLYFFSTKILKEVLIETFDNEIYKHEKSKYTNKHTFSGKLVCACCGSSYVGGENRKRKDGTIRKTWRCYTATKYGKKHEENGQDIGCNNDRVNNETLKICFMKALKEVLINKKEIKKETEQYIKLVLNKCGQETQLNDILVKDKEQLMKERSRLLDLCIKGIVDEETFSLKNNEIIEKINKIEIELDSQKQKVRMKENAEEILEKIQKTIDNILNIKKFSKNVCKEFVDKIVIYNDKKFDFYLKGYDTSFNFNEESNISYLPH